MKYEFVKAKQFIENGWCQGHSRLKSEGKVSICAETALASCINHTPSYLKDLFQLNEHFRKANNIGIIFEWNDDPSRTKDEVLAAFDRAIAALPEE